MKYFRFPISGWNFGSPFNMEKDEGILRFMNPVWFWIERALLNRKNVLIHCLAGAHRAGTTGISWLMYANKLPANKAIKLAKSRRSIISPICDFKELL